MKLTRSTLAAAALLAIFTGQGFAQTGPVVPNEVVHTVNKDVMHAHMGDRHTKHLAELKGKLKLDANQENAWATFAQNMQAPAKPMSRLDRAAMEKLTTPERIDQIQSHKAQRDADMQKRAEATKTFYASLSPEQKKWFDNETARSMHGMHSRTAHPYGSHGHH